MSLQPNSKTLPWPQYIFLNINWFALTLRSQMLAGLLVPLFVEQFVGPEQKGTYFGIIRLWGLMAAVLFQALFGILSDHSRLRWGRRRPFIFIGALVEAVLILSLAWVAGLSGMTGYFVLFGIYILAMASSNLSQAATQGFIPDLVPQEKRGIASGIKTLMEVPLPLVVFGLVIAPMVKNGNIFGGLLVTAAGMVICMALTMLVREERLESSEPLNWKPFVSLVIMTGVFTGIILGLGQLVKLLLPVLPAGSRVLYAALGIFAMGAAVILGVWASLSVHLGKAARENRAFFWLVVNRLAALAAITNISVFLLYFVQEKFNLPGKEAAGLAGQLPLVLGVCVILFGLVAGWLSDKVDRRVLTIAAGLIGAAGVAVIVLGETKAMMFVAAAIVGLAYALFSVASWALGSDVVPKERSAEFFGLQNIAGAGAGAIGAYIGGPIADASGFVFLMVIFGGMFLLSSLAALFLRPKQE